MANSSNQPSHPLRSEPTSKPAGLHLNNWLRLSHDRGPPKPAGATLAADQMIEEVVCCHPYEPDGSMTAPCVSKSGKQIGHFDSRRGRAHWKWHSAFRNSLDLYQYMFSRLRAECLEFVSRLIKQEPE